MLPPGQHEISHFPRFGVPSFAKKMPPSGAAPEWMIGDRTLALAELQTLPRKQLTADFHCVTTWTRRGLHWEGWSFRDLYEKFIAPREKPAFVELQALDGYLTSMPLEDALEGLIADRLDGEPLPLEHGAPLRLIVPDLYGYKNIKYLCRIDLRTGFRAGFAERLTRAHPRGRVALEERGRWLPGWLYRVIYRASFRPTLWYYRRVDRKRLR